MNEFFDDETILITVDCNKNIVFRMEITDTGDLSTVKIYEQNSEIITMSHSKLSKQSHISENGTILNIRNYKYKKDAKEKIIVAKKLKKLGDAIRLIHDELNLKGWESPAVMFLYRLGKSLRKFQKLDRITKHKKVDSRVYDYNGANANIPCSGSGTPADDVDDFIADKCFGLCGLDCDCWYYVCGDCCIHTGCMVHDTYCRGDHGVLSTNCLSLRGVLWDTVTDVTFDC